MSRWWLITAAVWRSTVVCWCDILLHFAKLAEVYQLHRDEKCCQTGSVRLQSKLIKAALILSCKVITVLYHVGSKGCYTVKSSLVFKCDFYCFKLSGEIIYIGYIKRTGGGNRQELLRSTPLINEPLFTLQYSFRTLNKWWFWIFVALQQQNASITSHHEFVLHSCVTCYCWVQAGTEHLLVGMHRDDVFPFWKGDWRLEQHKLMEKDKYEQVWLGFFVFLSQ